MTKKHYANTVNLGTYRWKKLQECKFTLSYKYSVISWYFRRKIKRKWILTDKAYNVKHRQYVTEVINIYIFIYTGNNNTK